MTILAFFEAIRGYNKVNVVDHSTILNVRSPCLLQPKPLPSFNMEANGMSEHSSAKGPRWRLDTHRCKAPYGPLKTTAISTLIVYTAFIVISAVHQQ